MQWISSTTVLTSIYGRLVSVQRDENRIAQRIEEIRGAMLTLLGDDGAERYPRVARRIKQCSDELALWHVRPELMAALADLHGERVAHQRVSQQTVLFKGLLPKSMTTRAHTSRF